MNNEDVKVGDTVVVPKGTTVAQWGTMTVTKRDKKAKVFRIVPLDEWTAQVVHGQWAAGTVVAQFFDKSTLNAVRVQDLQKADTQSKRSVPRWVKAGHGGG